MAKKSWHDDEEQEEVIHSKVKAKAGVTQKAPPQRTGSLGFSDSAEVDQKIHETKVLMEQTHHLYQHYFNGIEKRPPIEKARILEAKIAELQRITATITSAKFKVSQFILQYKTFRELWDRKLRNMESS